MIQINKPKLAWYEDNQDFTDPVVLFLERYFQIKVISSPDKTEKKIIKYKPDIIIFDYRMRNITGLEMYQKLKKKKLQFVAMFYTIWEKDYGTIEKITSSGIPKESIIDKAISAKSFAEIVIEFYKHNQINI